MMRESKRDEHRRLQKRTDELKKDHAALARSRKPFNKVEHDAHTANLAHHKADLKHHRTRDD